jgi:ribosome-associated translation inhibitor RaiA
MELHVASPGNHLTDEEIDGIKRDLDKIDRRLADHKQVVTSVRISQSDAVPLRQAMIEVHYGRNHLIAKAEHQKLGQAVRAAREEILRQINDRSRRGHSSFTKHR